MNNCTTTTVAGSGQTLHVLWGVTRSGIESNPEFQTMAVIAWRISVDEFSDTRPQPVVYPSGPWESPDVWCISTPGGSCTDAAGRIFHSVESWAERVLAEAHEAMAAKRRTKRAPVAALARESAR